MEDLSKKIEELIKVIESLKIRLVLLEDRIESIYYKIIKSDLDYN